MVSQNERFLIPGTPDAQRFWSRAVITPTCWLWNQTLNKNGTGRIKVIRDGQEIMISAHRGAYQLAFGDVPLGCDVKQTCGIRHCVNPQHLLVQTRSETIRERPPRPKKPVIVRSPEENRRRFATTGVDDFATLHPELISLWHPDNQLDPKTLYPKSGRRMKWICELDHDWVQAVFTVARTGRANACPYCNGRKVWPGFNDLGTIHPEIATTLLNEDPSTLLPNSPKNFEWVCDLGHVYTKAVRDRVKGSDCQYCGRTKLLVGFNDLATTHPEVAAQWSRKNKGLATDVLSGHNGKVLWECGLGHEWPASPNGRTTAKNGMSPCIYCANLKCWPGFNDLQTRNPQVAIEYAIENHTPVTHILFGSNKKVLWRCTKGHEWRTTVVARTLLEHGCASCVSATSREETAVHDEMLKSLPDLHQGQRLDVGWGKASFALVDMYSKAANLVIEYDGSWWHKDTYEKDTVKTEALLHHGYRVIRIREGDLKSLGIPGLTEIFGDRSDLAQITKQLSDTLLELGI